MASQTPNDPPTQAAPGGMFGRIKRILLEPRAEWQRIDAEPMTVSGIFTGWVVPLAAIGPVATFIGRQLFSPMVGLRPSLGSGLATALLTYGLTLLGIWLLATVIDALAPSFDSSKSKVQAMKVAAFSSTASFLAGIFGLIPTLAFLGLLGLYSFYLLWVGLPLLMKTPADKGVVYVIVTIVAMIVIYIVVAAIVGLIVASVIMGASPPANYVPPA